MGLVIQFPSNESRREKEFQELLLDGLNFSSESARQYVKDSIVPMLLKYEKLPSHTFTLALSSNISDDDGKMIALRIQEEVKNYIQKIQQPMLLEMCQLHVALWEVQQK